MGTPKPSTALRQTQASDLLSYSIAGADYQIAVDDSAQAHIVRCIANDCEIKVPRTIGGYPVVEIGEEAFATSRTMASPAMQAPATRAAWIAQLGNIGSPTTCPNGNLKRVSLPEGVSRIGRAAFRGCAQLVEIALPNSCEEIDDLAFSCSGIRSIRIPRTCSRLSRHALRTGPETVTGTETAYCSKICSIEVDDFNTSFCMKGPVLCRRSDDTERLEAILCPSHAETVDLRGIARIAPATFAGTTGVDDLIVPKGIGYDPAVGLLSNCSCKRITLVRAICAANGAPRHDDLPENTDDSRACQQVLSLEMPAGQLGRDILATTRGSSTFDVEAFLQAYDAALPQMDDPLAKARLVLARYGNPVLLQADTRTGFERYLQANLDAMIVHFGARALWDQFDLLASAGLLDECNTMHAIDILSAVGDAASIGRLLEIDCRKQRNDAWDYDL